MVGFCGVGLFCLWDRKCGTGLLGCGVLRKVLLWLIITLGAMEPC